jgi:hypothetical protein
VANQALIGGEWMLGSFEAKTVAYALFVGALLAVSTNRIPLAVALIGLTVSFHPAVGVWAAWAAGVALLALRETRGATLRWLWLALLLAIPGIVGALSATGDASAAIQRFVVLQAIPYHLDPFFGGQTLASEQVVLHTLVVLGMFAFNLWAYSRSDRDLTQRFLAVFQIAAAVPFALAYIARAFHWWGYLRFMPLRSFPLIVPLVFFFQAVRLARRAASLQGISRRRRRRARRNAALAFVVIIAVALVPTSPLLAAPRFVYRNVQAWTKADDVAEAFNWVRRHTPKATVCIVPVDRQDAFVRGERAIVANWQAIPYDRLGEWRRRVERLVGGPAYFHGRGWRGGLPDLRHAYNQLTLQQVRAIATRYDATCFVSETLYPLQVLHRVGNVRVYAVTPR